MLTTQNTAAYLEKWHLCNALPIFYPYRYTSTPLPQPHQKQWELLTSLLMVHSVFLA